MSFTISTLHMIASTIFLYASFASRTLFYSQIFHLFFNNIFIFPFVTSVVWVWLIAFYALYFTACVAVYFSCLLYLTLREDVLTILTLNKLSFTLLNKLSYFNIAYLLELLLWDQCSNVIHVYPLLTISIGTFNSLLIRAISKISNMICNTEPTEWAFAID